MQNAFEHSIEDRSAGWKIYNFEVGEHHTYVADGVRVHNQSLNITGLNPDGTISSLTNRLGEEVEITGTWTPASLHHYGRVERDEDGVVTSVNGGTFGQQLGSFFRGLADAIGLDGRIGYQGTFRTTENAHETGVGGPLIVDWSGDQDGDGTPDYRDEDYSNIGHWGGDRDGDGIPNIRDFNDGVGFRDKNPGGGGDTDGSGKPVILDLDGDGVEIAADGQTSFDIDADGFLEQVSWAAPDDGFLVVDLNEDLSRGGGDGKITSALEVAFSLWADEGVTDLEALAVSTDADGNLIFDSNGDGVLSAADNIWNELRIWQDLDQDGETEGDGTELKTLAAWGITQINLTYDDGSAYDDFSDDIEIFGNTLFGTASYTKDGQVIEGGVGDVALAFSGKGYRRIETSDGFMVEFEGDYDSEVLELNGSGQSDYDLFAEDLDGVFGDARNNILNAALVTTAVQLGGGDGNDTLTGGSGNDYIDGSSGADNIDGGAGDDVLFIDADDISSGSVSGGEDYDTLIVGGDTGVNITLSDHAVESVFGSAGADVLSGVGSIAAIALHGGDGNDSLIGSDNDDLLSGDIGADSLDAGMGNDYAIGGDGNDVLDGGSGSDILSGGNDNDDLTGGSGNDRLLGDDGDDYLFGGGGTEVGFGATVGGQIASVRTNFGSTSYYEDKIDDVNGDGIDDILNVYSGNGGVWVYSALGQGDGTFGDVIAGGVGQYQGSQSGRLDSDRSNFGSAYKERTGDLNGDGFADIAVIHSGTGGVWVYTALGNGDGTFGRLIGAGDGLYQGYKTGKIDSERSNFATTNLYANYLTDVNGDGFADLAMAFSGTSGTWVYTAIGNGDGTFQTVTGAGTGSYGGGTSGKLDSERASFGNSSDYQNDFGDFNGDGLADVVTFFSGASGVWIYTALGNGDGTFQTMKGGGIGTYLGAQSGRLESDIGSFGATGALDKRVGDFDGDGYDDLAVISSNSSGLKAYLATGDGTGNFSKIEEYQLTNYLPNVGGSYTNDVGDFNGDGVEDLVITHSGTTGVWSFATLSEADGNDELFGGTGNDTLDGGTGNDLLDGGADDDVLIGGLGSDEFYFEAGDGSDVISDFQDGIDKIVISDGAFGDLLITQSGANTLVSYEEGSITLTAFDSANLTEEDFIFV